MSQTPTRLRIDVWGGECSMDHMARTDVAVTDLSDHLDFIQAELDQGFLVNLRALGPDEGWGPDTNFDARTSTS
jgi:hypothetical protein